MTGGTVSGNSSIRGGGVFNGEGSVINMSDGIITGNSATYGGGVCNRAANASSVPVTFSMSGGTISYNTANYGGGIHTNSTAAHVITINDGTISNNTANYGGGIYSENVLSITGGKIIGNTANGPDATSTIGSGGGIYTTRFSNLTVGSGVIFSGNHAPTLRAKDIAVGADIDKNGVPDLTDYNNISPGVVLDAFVKVGQNAPAYNNHDINYPGEYYTVYIDIEPNGSGTVTFSYIFGGNPVSTVVTKDGYFYVPNTVGSLALSATPNGNYEFIQFVINGSLEIDDDSTEILISGDTTILARFFSVLTPPGYNDYTITASADGGSTITPSGIVKVSAGDDKTFTFSARPGYQIAAVFVDDVAISSTLLASGEYTFRYVESNHTIRVVSEPAGGAGDDIGIDGDERGSTGGGKWAVLNLVCAIIAIFSGIVALIAGRNRIKKEKNKDEDEESSETEEEEEDEEEEDEEGDKGEKSKTALIFRVLALIVGIVSVVVFFLTEDWKLPVVPMDVWTPLMFILLLVTLAFTMSSFWLDEDPKEEEEEEENTTEPEPDSG